MLQAIFESTTGVHPPCFILELPSELQLRIFENLSVKDIRRCIQTCRSFRNIISTSMELQYQIHLAAHCLRLLRDDDQPIHKRRLLLQEKVRALDTFDYVKVGSTTLDTYDIRHDKPPRVFFADGWLGATYRARGNFAARLIDCNATTPSQSLRTWARETLNPTQPFLFLERPILDVWQDLLVCPSVRTGVATSGEPACYLELRTISGPHGDPHPLAARGTLVSAGFPYGGMVGFEPAESKFEVNGNFVAMLKTDHGRRFGFFSLLQVWNWKEGRTTSILERHDKQPYLDDFCFLDSGRLLVLTVPGSCIAVYSYADFDKPLHLQARFMLTTCMPRSTHLYTSPFPDSVYTQGGGSRGPAYVPSLEGRISVLATTDPGRLLVIWNDIFLPHVPHFPDIQQDKDVYIVPWNTWGPANTRALTVCGPQKLLFSVSGSRLLLGRPIGGRSGGLIGEKHELYMLEFDPARVSMCDCWDDDSEEEDGDEATVVSRPNIIRTSCASKAARQWFPGATLPYHETMLTSLSNEPLAGVHMDENGVALIRCRLSDPHAHQMQLVAEVFKAQCPSDSRGD